MKIIEFLISPKGETTLQTKGIAGPECQETSRPYEQALGVRTAETLTAEFHQTQTEPQRNAQRP